MNLDGLSMFHLMGQKLNWLGARQTVLSQNVANADTPGYKPKDLKPFTFGGALQLAKAVPLAETNAMHIQGGGASSKPALTRGEIIEEQPDGNAVSIEDQLAKVANTATDYEMVINLYRKQIGLLKTAIGRGGNA